VRHTYEVQSAFAWVIWIVCGLGIVIAVVVVIGTGKTWDDYGKGHLVMDGDRAVGPKQVTAVSTAERDEEIRQLLEARNLRRARRGEPPLDIEQELRRLVAPLVDDELRGEIREMVLARNYRRLRQGKEPLDVQAEIERQIADLSQT
jgi:hypothetical protein